MSEEKILPNIHLTGAWLWQCGIVLPEGQPTEYPICPFCTTSPFQEFKGSQVLPSCCTECGANLKLEGTYE